MSEDEKNVSFCNSAISEPSSAVGGESERQELKRPKTDLKWKPLNNKSVLSRAGRTSDNLDSSRKKRGPSLSFLGSFKSRNMFSFRGNPANESAKFSASRLYKVGLLSQLAEDNVLSMRWHSENDKEHREKSPCGLCTSILVSCIFMILFLLLFTFLPRIDRFSLDRSKIDNFVENSGDGISLELYISVGIAVVTYILDLHNGGIIQQRIAAILYMFSIVSILFGLSFVYRDGLVIPFAVYVLSAPVICSMIKMVFFPRMDPLFYTLGLMFPVWLAVGIAFIVTGQLFPWYPWSSDAIKAVYYREAGCDISIEETEAALFFGFLSEDEFNDGEIFSPNDSQQDLFSSVGRSFNKKVGELIEESSDTTLIACETQAWFLYFGPVVFVIFGSIFFWLMAEVLRVSYADRTTRQFSNLSISFQVFILCVSIGTFSAWIAATILDDGSSSVSLPSVILGFSAVLFGLGAFVSYYVLKPSYLAAQLNRTPIGKRLYEMRDSDLVKAAAVYFLLPVYIFWALIGILTQTVRKFTPLGKSLSEEDRKFLGTKESVDVLRKVETWDLGHILHKCMVIGIAYFGLVVFIGRFTTVILAGCRDLLEDVDLIFATIAFIVIGLGMFLLPPVPGLPVYLAGGVILFSNARSTFSDTGAMVYAVLVNFVLKLLAVAVEQKILGEHFGSRNVAIRSMCGVNNPSLKAINHILAADGQILGKVAILCGGPDWPTSVLTGIMKQSLWKMLLGTIPVIVLVIFSTLAGAFLVVSPSDDDVCNETNIDASACFTDITDAVRAIMLAGTVVVQAALFILAFYYIAKTVDTNQAALDAIPNDDEVERYDAMNKELSVELHDLQSWHNLPYTFKAGHVIAVFLFLVSNWTFQFFSSVAFVDVEPTESAQMPFTSTGYIVLIVWIIPFLYFMFYRQILKRKAKINLEKRKQRPVSKPQEAVNWATNEQLIVPPLGTRAQLIGDRQDSLEI